MLVTPQPSSSSRFPLFSALAHPRSSISHHSLANSTTSPASCSSGSASTCGTWSVLDEIELAESTAKRNVPKESRREKKHRERMEKQTFDPDMPPSTRMLFEASLLEVVDEHGHKIRFGDLVRGRKTIVIFIRHWFCPLCAQYMNSIISEVSLEALEEANVDLIIIGNGSDKMLDGYRNKSFRCPFKMFTDPSLALYRALGLTRQTADAGPDEEKGDYLVQSAMESTVQTLKRATKMPLRNPGHFTQLGGEFIFDGTLSVSYTHRMTTTRSHAAIRDICAEAGVRLEYIHYEPGPPPPPVHRRSYIAGDAGVGEEEGNDWQKQRDETLERMKAMKLARREGVKSLEVRDTRRRVGLDGVTVVGQDIEEEDVEEGFEALGLAM